jgi:hypothetical protein
MWEKNYVLKNSGKPKRKSKNIASFFDHYISRKKTFMLPKNLKISEKILKIILKFPQSSVKQQIAKQAWELFFKFLKKSDKS